MDCFEVPLSFRNYFIAFLKNLYNFINIGGKLWQSGKLVLTSGR